MATTFTTATLANTYKDDFRDSDNYHRILFNSGVGLQARELTQLQTILQQQIGRFGNNIFKEGAVIKPGGANINPQYEFIKLDETDPSHVMPEASTLIGKTVEGQSSGIFATIIEAVAASGGDPATIYVKYTKTNSAQTSTDTSTRRMSSNELMDLSGGGVLKVKLSTVADPSTGKGTQVTLLGGIYYARGNFVFTQDQSKIISKYTDTPTTDVGFKVVEDVVTANDNNALYDNQGVVPNVSAPGADRYRIRLTIAEKSELSANENFVHVITIKKGEIFKAVDINQSLNIPNQIIAKRIEENSGDYVVKPFKIKFLTDSQDTHLRLQVSDGVVVVDGFRAARSYPTVSRVLKPTATTTINNEPTGVALGSFVLVSPDPNNNTKGIPNINQLELLNLRDSVAHGGNTIGFARVKAITEDGVNLKMHLIDIQMNSGQAFRNVKSIGTSSSNYFNVLLENSKAVLKQPGQYYGFFPLPRSRPQSITDLIYIAQRQFTGKSATGSGVLALQGLSGGEAYTQTSGFVFAKEDSDITAASPTITLSGGGTAGNVDFGTTSDVATIASSSNIEYAAYINKTQTTPKTKTLTSFDLIDSVDSNGEGFKFINLKRADVFEVDEIFNVDDSNENYANRFFLDNGQRSTHYDVGRLILAKGQSAPSGLVHVKYKFFNPSVSGDYFSVNSYTGQVDYSKIPSFKIDTNREINLRDVIDFRSVADSAGNFNTSGATMLEMPQDGSTITADVTYNLAKSAKLVIDHQSNLNLVTGENGFLPSMPNTPERTLPLYDILLHPATFNDSDVSTSKYNFKRFTMKDIGKLEQRIERLEETSTLNLLELDTKYTQVIDSSGNDRTKSGFFVDDFKNHSGADLSIHRAYRASIDFKNQVLRPMTREDNLRMIYDSAASVTANGGLDKVIKKGDNVYIAHDEEEYISQTTASQAIKINPFAVTIYQGTIDLSPASDEWRDIDRVADKIIQGGTLISAVKPHYFNDHIANWCGNTEKDAVNRVVTDESILELIEDRVLEFTSIPFMRARKVFFKAEGLRPNSRVFPFLDGNNISDFTNGGDGHSHFQFYTQSDSDFGNTLKNITQHPDGSTTLETDGDGRVSGSFIVPNYDSLRIGTGTRQFKLLDISVDNEQDAATVSSAPYTASGFLDTKQATYRSTRIVVTPGQFQYIEGSHGDGTDGLEGITIHEIGGEFSGNTADRTNLNKPSFEVTSLTNSFKGGAFTANDFYSMIGGGRNTVESFTKVTGSFRTGFNTTVVTTSGGDNDPDPDWGFEEDQPDTYSDGYY